MPTTRRTRTLEAAPQEVWRVVGDPHHLPRWWPRVTRVEGVDPGAFTQVFITAKGRTVRADHRVMAREEGAAPSVARRLEAAARRGARRAGRAGLGGPPAHPPGCCPAPP
ncbi:MAG TPA: SRPBCC family protein [Solirubrobacteraceae bacterium]|nr:SRPBCC family protein [Solirubrobacteraceae bacterium]